MDEGRKFAEQQVKALHSWFVRAVLWALAAVVGVWLLALAVMEPLK